MYAILGKIKADVLSRPLISILILVTIVTSSALLTLALATLANTRGPYEQTFQELDAAHVWLYFDRARVSTRDIAKIEALPGVIGSTGLRYDVISRARLSDTRLLIELRQIPDQQPAVNRLLIQGGRYLATHQAEVLASDALADIHPLSPGDTILLTDADGKEVELPIVGLAYDPMWDSYASKRPPYLYVSEETLQGLFPDESMWGWSIGLRLADPQAVDEFVALVEETLHGDVVDSHTDWRDVQESAIFDAQIGSVFLGAFSFFAIVATVLVVASSISAIVLSQYRQIGILKAVGFTRGQVLWLYLGQYLVLCLIGCPLGLLLGIALAPLPLQSVAISLNTTFRPPFSPSIVSLVFGIATASVLLATVGAAIRGSRTNIIRAIAIGAEAPRKKSPRMVTWAARLGLPQVLVLGLGDVFAKPFRSFMIGFNLTLGVMGIVFGLALTETMDTYRQDPSLLGITYDAIVTRERTSERKAQHLLGRAPGVKAFYGEVTVDVETLEGQTFQAKMVDGDVEAFPIRIDEGRFFQADTFEAIAGRGLLDELGLQVGDEITVIVEDKENRPVTWQIVGQYPEPANAGRMLMVSLPPMARWIGNVEPRIYRLALSPDCDRGLLRQTLEPRRDSDLSLTFVDQSVPDEIVYLQLAIFGLSAILVLIALINVFNTSLLAVRERLRVVGVLKTVGMTPGQVLIMVNTTAGFSGLVAAVAGIPLGLLFTQSLLDVLSASYGFSDINLRLRLVYIVALIPIMILVSMVGSTVPGRWAATVPIVQVLRSE